MSDEVTATILLTVTLGINKNLLWKLKHIKDKLLQLNSIGCCRNDSEMKQQNACTCKSALTDWHQNLQIIHLHCPVHEGCKDVDFNTGISLEIL